VGIYGIGFHVRHICFEKNIPLCYVGFYLYSKTILIGGKFMSRLLISASFLALIVGGCGADHANNQQAMHQGATEVKPIVAIVPVIDNTKNDYDWNLSDEFSSEIYSRLAQLDKLNVLDAARVRGKMKKLKEGENPFGPDVSWIKKAFQGDQFVVFLELVEHEEVYKQDRRRPSDPQECSADLNMSMRVRVFDLRGNEPKTILQELVHDSHFIPRQFTQVNFYQVPWGHSSFSISPLGLAHAEFTKEIASRLEDYILMSAKE
jgi:hypothetical protein